MQSPLHPIKGDPDFLGEIENMVDAMRALFYAIGYSDVGDVDEELHQNLARLGNDIARQAKQRVNLLQRAEGIHAMQEKAFFLKKRPCEKKEVTQ